MDEIVIKNKRILQFYSQNPQISIESMNLLIIDLLEQINNGMNEHIISGINSQILSDVGSMRTEIDNLSKNVVKMNNDLTNNIIVKMQDVKKDYIEETFFDVSNWKLPLRVHLPTSPFSNVDNELIAKTSTFRIKTKTCI